MTSNETKALVISERDAQFLVTLGVAYSTYVACRIGQAPEEAVDHNDAALDQVFARHFSAREFNDLILRLKGLLPATPDIQFAAPDGGGAYVH